MGAGGKGVQALDAVRKAMLDQKLQRAVGDRGLVAKAIGRKPRQHIIGPKRLVLLKQDFQHAAANRGQSCPGSGGDRFGPRQRFAGAVGVIMHRKGRVNHGRIWVCVWFGRLRHDEGDLLLREGMVRAQAGRCALCDRVCSPASVLAPDFEWQKAPLPVRRALSDRNTGTDGTKRFSIESDQAFLAEKSLQIRFGARAEVTDHLCRRDTAHPAGDSEATGGARHVPSLARQ